MKGEILISYYGIDARENNDGPESAQVSISTKRSEESEDIGSSNPVSHMTCSIWKWLMHFKDQVSYHVHSYTKKC